MNRIIFSSLFLFTLPYSLVFSSTKIDEPNYDNKINSENNEHSSDLKLMGQFNGMGSKINNDKYIFTYNSDSQCYYLKIDLTKGDIFYIYQLDKTRALYYPIFNERACDDFESIGLTRSHYSGSYYFWKVELTGEYEITVDNSVENVQNVWDIWNDEYKSSIKYKFNNENICYFALDIDPSKKYFFKTLNESENIYQYGKKYGTKLYYTNNVSIYGNSNKKIFALEYDINYSSRCNVCVLNENDELIFQSPLIDLKNNYCYFSIETLDGDFNYADIVSILYGIDAGIGYFEIDGVGYEKCILSLKQQDAKRIFDTYKSLNEQQKEIVDKSTLTYVNSAGELKNNCQIEEVMNEIKTISIKKNSFPIIAIVLPFAVLIIGSIATYFLLYFKKRDCKLIKIL